MPDSKKHNPEYSTISAGAHKNGDYESPFEKPIKTSNCMIGVFSCLENDI